MGKADGMQELLKLNKALIVAMKDPKPGLWKLRIVSEGPHTVRVTGLSSLDFVYGFSRNPTLDLSQTERRPIRGKLSYISLTERQPIRRSFHTSVGQKFHQLLAVGQWFPPGTPVSSTRKLISSSFHRLDMTLAVAEALNPNKPNQTIPQLQRGAEMPLFLYLKEFLFFQHPPKFKKKHHRSIHNIRLQMIIDIQVFEFSNTCTVGASMAIVRLTSMEALILSVTVYIDPSPQPTAGKRPCARVPTGHCLQTNGTSEWMPTTSGSPSDRSPTATNEPQAELHSVHSFLYFPIRNECYRPVVYIL